MRDAMVTQRTPSANWKERTAVGPDHVVAARSLADAAQRSRRLDCQGDCPGKFGPGRWRKMIGEATIQLGDGTIERVELHWFEAHGIGRVYFKRKRNLNWRS